MHIAAKMRRDWDRRAREHARFWIATEDYQSEARFHASGEATARNLLAQLPARDWSRSCALEIGAGVGRVLRPLAEHFERVLGVDVAPAMVERSRAWLEAVPGARVQLGSGVDLRELSSASFDLVYAYVAFQHMPRPVLESYLRESRRVLREDGLLLFQSWVGERCDPPLWDTVSLRVYSLEELRSLLDAAGLELDRVRPQGAASGPAWSAWCRARRGALPVPRGDETWRDSLCPDAASPLDVGLRLGLAEHCERAGDRRQAIAVLTRLIEQHPDQLMAGIRLGELLARSGRAVEAAAQLRRLEAFHPDCEPLRRSLARLDAFRRSRARRSRPPELGA